MNWVDLLVLLMAVLAAISGARQGVVIALPAFTGVVLGAVVGVRVAPLIVKNFSEVTTRVSFSVAILVLMVALGETLGVAIGRAIKRHISNPKLAGVDNTLGAVVQGAVVFVVAWMIALPLTVFNGLPGLANALQNSTVLGAVNSIMPQSAQALPGDLRKLFDIPDLPAVVSPFAQMPVTEVSPPDTTLQSSAIVRDVQPSVVKIRGEAPSCSRSLEGSGFVLATHYVLTNAHVVAGTNQVGVEIGRGQLSARVVYYNPNIDVAVLDVPDLTATPLQINTNQAAQGSDSIVLGYPLDGPYTASAARVRTEFNLSGPNIYDDATISRQVYEVRANVRSGNSGGPLIDRNGQVIGLVFGAAVGDPDTGFALSASQVENTLPTNVTTLYRSVSTGQCAA